MRIHRILHHGVFDALQKKYLKTMILSIHDASGAAEAAAAPLLESFEYQIRYGADDSLQVDTRHGMSNRSQVSAATALFTREAVHHQAVRHSEALLASW